MKSKPLFADQLVGSPKFFLLPKNISLAAIQARIRRAERMVFDDAATKRVGEMIHEIPELLIEQLQFARAPFDLCWIEYQSNTMWEAVTGKRADPNDMTRDEVVGLLIDHGKVNVFSRCFDGAMCVMPIAYHLNTEWPLQDQLDFCAELKTSRMGIDLWLWGSIANHFRDIGRIDLLRSLRDVTMVELLDANMPTSRFLDASSGDFRNIVSLLLMLNQPRITQYTHIPRQRGWVGNKPKPLLSHHTIKISLDAKERLILLSEKGEGEMRRRPRHNVRGHYCHDQTARDYARIAGCIHDWEPMTDEWEPWPDAPLDEREHWKCRTCDGKRWWRIAHERGTTILGQVEHQYTVTL